MSLSMETYLRQMSNKFQYRATWSPYRKMQVGRFGSFSGSNWMEEGSLIDDFDLDIKISSDPGQNVLELTSETGVTISTKLSGKPSGAFAALSDTEAGIAVEFGAENAIVFRAKNITHHQLANKAAITRKIVDLWRKGIWKEHYLILSEVMEAASATILVSAGANAKIELKADATIETGNIDIADASLGLEAARDQNIGVNIVAKSGITPLYQVVGLKRKLWNDPELVIRNKSLAEMEDFFEIIPF
ncbi:MAG: hypothetical protein WA004_00185 [Saprospiraceae bacterium]